MAAPAAVITAIMEREEGDAESMLTPISQKLTTQPCLTARETGK
jgi:hypothetical protein